MPLNLLDPSLAVNGGTPVRTKPWLDNFTTGDEELRALKSVLDSGYLSKFEGSYTPDPPFSFHGGPFVQRFEAAWREYYGCRHAVSVNSATSGLYAALGALNVGFGDEVIVSPSTMSACAVGPLIYGAIPVFADIERETGALDPASIERNITPRTKAILVVHQYGIPADMDPIMELARQHDLKVIEDCAQSHAAKYKGRYVGTIGDIGVFSLNVNKSIQSGEGGVCITDDDDLSYRLELIRNHAEAVVGPAGYENIVNMIGFNYRLTELQAAVALEQLNKLDRINEVRMGYVDYLNEKLAEFDFLDLMPGREDSVSTFYTYPFRFNPEVAGVDYDAFHEALNAEGMYFLKGYRPLYMQPIYQTRTAFKKGYPWAAPENRDSNSVSYAPGTCPVAEEMEKRVLVKEYVRLPNTMEDMDDIVAAFEKIAGCAS